MKASEIRDLHPQEIESQIQKIRSQLFKYRFHAGNDEMQRAGEIRGLRKDIARLKTVLRQRQIDEAKQASATPAESAAGSTEATQ